MAMQDAREATLDYRAQAWDFLHKARTYLSDGDLHQASEKGWGAASHMAKAVAAARAWEYETHDHFPIIMDNVGNYSHQQHRVRRLGGIAERLHANYYKRKFLLNADRVAGDLDDMAELLEIVQPLTG